MRSAWKVEADSTVVLFCAKLQPWKRPGDLLEAFAAAGIFVPSWFSRAKDRSGKRFSKGLSIWESRIAFVPGFCKSIGLPGAYKASDLMVLPSEYEPFAVVVSEASCCGCPVAASDRVGATADLIAPVNPDFAFSCGDVPALTELPQKALSDPTELARRGQIALRRMQSWSARGNISGAWKPWSELFREPEQRE